MVKLLPPKVAIRIVWEVERKHPSVWHLRSAHHAYLTPCQRIHTETAIRKWEERPIIAIGPKEKWCKVCLGAIEVQA